MSKYETHTVEEWLNMVDYTFAGYMPTKEALMFVNFIKEVNGGTEENETPIVHLVMMDRVFNKDKRCAIMCHRGIGKLGTPNSLVMTSEGWRTMEQINVGDKVFTRNGTLANVSYKTPLQNPDIYKVTLTDGTTFEVGDEHNHIVWMYRKKEREKVLTTKELLSRPLYTECDRKDDVRNPKKQYTYSIPLVEPLQWPTINLPIDPYVMGYWLANGNYNRSIITCHVQDSLEIFNYVSKTLTIGSNGITTGNSYRMYILDTPFKDYYNKKAKFKGIPKDYAKSSIEQRLDLLRGLMDGDGHIAENGNCSFSSYSKQLAHDVRDLARSLGAISYVQEYNCPSKPGKIEYRTIVNIKLNPFRLKRKATKWKPTKKTSRAIIDITKIESKGGYCIYVDDPTHSYITDGFTVTHNTTLFAEYLILFIATLGYLPGFGPVKLGLYVTDSIENGVKNLRRNVEFRYNESDFLQRLIPNRKIRVGSEGAGFIDSEHYDEAVAGGRKFTDIRLEFMNHQGHTTIFKGFGSKALSLDSILYKPDGYTTIGECQIGDQIYGADGKITTIIEKSIVFDKPMYLITLCDGRSIKVSEDHLNPVIIKEDVNNYCKYKEYILPTKTLLNVPLFHTRYRFPKNKEAYISNEARIFIKNCEPLEYSEKELPIDPYTLGVILGDGRIRKDCGSVELTGHIDDFPTYLKEIPYTFGKYQIDKRNTNVRTQSIRGLGKILKSLNLNVHGDYKYIPEIYFRSSIQQRLNLLQGLMDTDGCVTTTGRTHFNSNSRKLMTGIAVLVRSLGGIVKLSIQSKTNKKTNNIEIWLNMPMFRLERKLQRQRFDRKADKVAIASIERIPNEPSQCIAVDNEEHQFVTTWFTRTHNTGVRGAKELGQRPTLALLDDLVSDTDAESDTVIKRIENTIYKAVSKALHPTVQKIIWLGTPFNARDPLYKAVESGAWKVSVFPICEKFPVPESEFRGSWIDRFPYSYVKDEYDEAIALGKPENFNQELMLRIMSEEDRLIKDEDIQWYSRANVLKYKSRFNFYITTDFATNSTDANDHSVIMVWALNYKGQWFLVDGMCRKQLMDKNINDLFFYSQKYNPQSVGIEVSGQQGGFIPWIQEQMMTRNIYFNIASDGNSNKPGIKPNTNKMQRFNIVLPWFTLKNIHFPAELKETPLLLETIIELTQASKTGFKSKNDDCIDTISMLGSLQVWRPSEEMALHKDSSGVWALDEDENDIVSLLDSSYIV